MTYNIVKSVLLTSSVFFRGTDALHSFDAKLGHNPDNYYWDDDCVGCPPLTYAGYDEPCDNNPCNPKLNLVCRYTNYGQRCKYPDAMKVGKGELCGDSNLDVLAGLQVECQYPLVCKYNPYTPGTKSGTGYTCQDNQPTKLQNNDPCGPDALSMYMRECESWLVCEYGLIRGGKLHTCQSRGAGSQQGRRRVGLSMDTATGSAYNSKAILGSQYYDDCVGCQPDHLIKREGDPCDYDTDCINMECRWGVIPGGHGKTCQQAKAKAGRGDPCAYDSDCEYYLQCRWGTIPGGHGMTCN